MDVINQARNALHKVILGKENVTELLFIALLSEGHVLLESVPGTGKTKLAKSFARVINGEFSRIQFTSDVLPSDITGIRFFNPKSQDFELRVGPIKTNILLADEINRATPKTQSSLLEAMEEAQATIDGETISLERPFLVIATQNPVEQSYGTFPLPEAQLDRFLFKIDLGYPSKEEDLTILQTYRNRDPLQQLVPLLSLEQIRNMQTEVKDISISDLIFQYMIDIVHASREHESIELGISTRGMISLMHASQARAYLHGRTYVTPEDIKQLVPYIFVHRLILTMEGSMTKTPNEVVREVLDQVEVPVEYGVKA